MDVINLSDECTCMSLLVHRTWLSTYSTINNYYDAYMLAGGSSAVNVAFSAPLKVVLPLQRL